MKKKYTTVAYWAFLAVKEYWEAHPKIKSFTQALDRFKVKHKIPNELNIPVLDIMVLLEKEGAK